MGCFLLLSHHLIIPAAAEAKKKNHITSITITITLASHLNQTPPPPKKYKSQIDELKPAKHFGFCPGALGAGPAGVLGPGTEC